MNKIYRYVERQAGQLNCSPAAFLIAFVFLIGIMVATHLSLVAETAIKTAAFLGIGCLGAGTVMTIRRTVHARRAVRPGEPAPTAKAQPLLDGKVATIEQVADMLAKDHVKLTAVDGGAVKVSSEKG